MKRALLDRLNAERAAHRPVALLTELRSGRQALVYLDGPEAIDGFGDAVLARARALLRADESALIEGPEGRIFIHVHNPPARLIVVGAVHIAEPLVAMAELTGYGVSVIDPRGAFARVARLGAARVIDAWPDEALGELKPDVRTAVVTLTHDPKIDDPALEAALATDAFYIGALGSTRTHAKRLARLRARGISEDALARIHGPVGLPIGARSPAEVALSIMAQITTVRRLGARAARSA